MFFLGDKFNGSIYFDIRGQHEVLKFKFKVIRVSKSALGASPAFYISRIPRANQDEQNPPPPAAIDTKTATKASMWTAPRIGQLYMTLDVREGNSDRLFEVENVDCPPSLSKHGVLRSGQKSYLLSCLEVDCPSDFDEADAKLIDGAHMVHVLRPDASIKSFRNYADKNVIPSPSSCS